MNCYNLSLSGNEVGVLEGSMAGQSPHVGHQKGNAASSTACPNGQLATGIEVVAGDVIRASRFRCGTVTGITLYQIIGQ